VGNWKDSQQEDTQTIEIHLTRGVVMALGLMLLVAAALGYLAWSEREAAAAGAQSISAQAGTPAKYYLTSSAVAANNALTACATGYHMASMWEIIDVSNLEYNSTLSYTLTDSGSGPPSVYQGWVRTGYNTASSTTPGQGNCLAWTSTVATNYGTTVRLPPDWTVAAAQSAPWEADAEACNVSTRVWCVGDDVIGGETYLPNVVKSY